MTLYGHREELLRAEKRHVMRDDLIEFKEVDPLIKRV
jgi:hypothetical protein